MSDFLNPNGGPFFGGIGQSGLIQPQLQQIPVPQQPSLFRRILGGVAGMAGNFFAPGLGGALGSLIGGGGSALGPGALGSLFGGSAAFTQNLAAAESAANAQDFAAEQQLLAVQRQENEQQEAIETASSVQKSKHQTLISVIQNIGS